MAEDPKEVVRRAQEKANERAREKAREIEANRKK